MQLKGLNKIDWAHIEVGGSFESAEVAPQLLRDLTSGKHEVREEAAMEIGELVSFYGLTAAAAFVVPFLGEIIASDALHGRAYAAVTMCFIAFNGGEALTDHSAAAKAAVAKMMPALLPLPVGEPTGVVLGITYAAVACGHLEANATFDDVKTAEDLALAVAGDSQAIGLVLDMCWEAAQAEEVPPAPPVDLAEKAAIVADFDAALAGIDDLPNDVF